MFFSVVLILLIFWLGNSLVNLSSQRSQIDKDIKAREDKISEAEKNSKSLTQFLKNIENPAFLEREARTKYNYKKSDEQLVFVYPDNTSQATSQSFTELLKSMSNWKKWGYWLLGH